MEVAFRADKSERGCVENSGNIGLESASLKHVSDPVVYKLVRIDVDGRLVPATDDELAEVENLLESENDYLFSGSDVFDTVRQGLEKDDPNTSQNKGSTQIKNEDDDASVNPHLKVSLYASESNSKLVDKSNRVMDTLSVENGKTNSCGSGPNFSLLKGDINLDQLTIRQLQETFRATFGRKTSAKDKVWLKRRIAMGLTNSCDVSATSYMIGDGKLLQKSDDICNGGEVGSSGDDMSANTGSHLSLSTDGADSVISMTSLDESAQRAAKRFRKPRKRYIEELSEKETSDNTEKSVVSSKDNEHDKPSLSSANKAAWSANTGAFVTRRDLFGGSRVQVPFVSRVRRCRPRQSIMNIVKFDLNEVTLTRKKVESNDETNKAQFDTGSRVKSEDDKSIHHEDLMAINESAEKQSMTSMSDSTQKRELKIVDSGDYVSRDDDAGANSDDNVATVPTAKGGMRRKHHRAWTLTEVVKLVDGVSKFGPGHWSEIKRLSFSSYSYRTAVDLKDKWRNLLKASFATLLPAENGMNYRMKAPFLIPAPILVKVRELAEINGQMPK